MNKIKITANVLFSGLGCQERGIENSNLFDLQVNNISEINKEAILSYAAVHCGLTPDLINTYSEYPSKDEMVRQLTEINLGYEPEKNKRYNWEQFAKRKGDDIKKYWLANKLSNNLGDINQIEFLSYADLWTCSFPCTDISLAGNMKGLSPDSGTRSSLLWENIRLLKKAKEDDIPPKYILFENVKNLVSKKFMPDFNNLLDVLNDLGYNSYWQVINAKDCGIPQNRERVFVICIRKDIDKKNFTFPKPFDSGMRLKDILDKVVDGKYYISDSGIKYITDPKRLNKWNKVVTVDDTENIATSIMSKGIQNWIGTFVKDSSSETECRIRKLTPTECWKLMGLTEEDIQKSKAVGVSNSQLYKQAGNGIVTNCVELLFEHLYKSQYDRNYECTDANFTQPQSD